EFRRNVPVMGFLRSRRVLYQSIGSLRVPRVMNLCYFSSLHFAERFALSPLPLAGEGEESKREREKKASDMGRNDHSENTKIIVADLPMLRSSGVVATRPMELRVSPVAIAMYCLPLTS